MCTQTPVESCVQSNSTIYVVYVREILSISVNYGLQSIHKSKQFAYVVVFRLSILSHLNKLQRLLNRTAIADVHVLVVSLIKSQLKWKRCR